MHNLNEDQLVNITLAADVVSTTLMLLSVFQDKIVRPEGMEHGRDFGVSVFNDAAEASRATDNELGARIMEEMAKFLAAVNLLEESARKEQGK